MRWQFWRTNQTGLGQIGFSGAGSQQDGLSLPIIGVAVPQQISLHDRAAQGIDRQRKNVVFKNDQPTLGSTATRPCSNGRCGTSAVPGHGHCTDRRLGNI